MNRDIKHEPTPQLARPFPAGIAYAYYLLTILTAIVVLFLGSRLNFLIDVVATAFYISVTVLFYALTKSPRILSRQGKRV